MPTTPDAGIEFRELLNSLAPRIEVGLREYAWPEIPKSRIREAMDYSLYAGGKRLRPALLLLACEACGGEETQAMPIAVAYEMLHTYSLIHDDLPAMDDDDLRRGKPSNHKVFGEATAILAGDAMLTYAFELIAREAADGEKARQLLLVLTRAAGVFGMVGGQQDDLEGEDRDDFAIEDLVGIHRRKTASLIAAALESGAIVADSVEHRAGLNEFGQALGLAFQVVDDILDATSSAEELGKSPGKDAATGKLTYVRLLGLKGARHEAEQLASEARGLAENLPNPDKLLLAVNYIVNRSH